MLTLYRDAFWISPYVFSCFVALEEKGLVYEVKEVALSRPAVDGGEGPQAQPAYAVPTITARVPALDHDGFFVAESSAIIEYLEDLFPEPRVLPANAKDRARARQVMSWIRSDDTLPIRQERPTSTMFYEHTKAPLSETGRRSATKLFQVGERLLGNGKATLGKVADADLAFMLQRLIMNGDDVPPMLRSFAESQWSRPVVQKFVAIGRKPYVPY